MAAAHLSGMLKNVQKLTPQNCIEQFQYRTLPVTKRRKKLAYKLNKGFEDVFFNSEFKIVSSNNTQHIKKLTSFS